METAMAVLGDDRRYPARMRFSIRTLLSTVLAMAVLLAAFIAAQNWLDGETELSRLTLPNETELRFTIDNFHDEGGRSIYWQRLVDSKPPEHRHVIGHCYPERAFDAEFKFTATEDGDLIVVYERRNPDVVLGFIEFSTGIQYPGNGEPPWDEYYANMNAVIQKLRDEQPDKVYILSHQVPGDRPLFVR